MTGVLEKRRKYLRLLRQCTLDNEFFTVIDFAKKTRMPRSTAQDWINRLLSDDCITILREKKGQHPARYATTSAIPQSACRRIFTTIDKDQVEIYHECMSGSAAEFCEYHHRTAKGVLNHVSRDGTLLRECASIGVHEAEIGFYPKPAVGVVQIKQATNETITQNIRCVGGPAYSLTDMMAKADGVLDISISKVNDLVEGAVTTQALTYVAIGVDDTDTQGIGATFAIALALLQKLTKLERVMPIGHQVVMLNPNIEEKTGGNAASYIEIATDPTLLDVIRDKTLNFIADESHSNEWGVAMKTGFIVGESLRRYGQLVRTSRVKKRLGEEVASQNDISIYGGRGIIGALAAVSCIRLHSAILLNPLEDLR